MARYVDVDALLKSLTKFKENDWNKELCIPLPSVVDDCIDIVDEQPTADVVEVVRCKECIHMGTDKCPSQLNDADFYCCQGERREDGNHN